VVIELENKLKRPLMIRGRRIDSRLVLAPMSGLGHIAFRELLADYGGYGLLFSEMCSAKAVPQENRKISPVFNWREQELPLLVCQIFGSDPEVMVRAAMRIEQECFFGVDLNFGCSVAAICKQNCGAALLKNPKLAVEIVKRVRKAVSIPVFVKFRTGWDDDPNFAVDVSRRFEDAGSDALMFHPRVAPDRRSRLPKWEYIGRVREGVSIPVFGNGNVFDRQDCLKMLDDTGCAGIALGRIAVARPWIFRMWTGGFSPDPEIYRKTAERIADLLEKHYDPIRSVKRFKKFALYFAANFRFGHAIYNKLCRVSDMQAIRENIRRVFEKNPETIPRPNMNMF